jgi:hypothetical protein
VMRRSKNVLKTGKCLLENTVFEGAGKFQARWGLRKCTCRVVWNMWLVRSKLESVSP